MVATGSPDLGATRDPDLGARRLTRAKLDLSTFFRRAFVLMTCFVRIFKIEVQSQRSDTLYRDCLHSQTVGFVIAMADAPRKCFSG